jgi:hypothetical protein
MKYIHLKYIHSDPDRRAKVFACTFVAAGINFAIIVAVNGLGTILNNAFSSASALLVSACTRFC